MNQALKVSENMLILPKLEECIEIYMKYTK